VPYRLVSELTAGAIRPGDLALVRERTVVLLDREHFGIPDEDREQLNAVVEIPRVGDRCQP
jgi:hypothetical protein